MINVLFVCLGNICRSPMAEAVFRDLVEKEGLSGSISVDSAGTGDWHIGKPPHQGTRELLDRYGIPHKGMKARQVCERDYADYTYIVCMDSQNLEDVKRWLPLNGPVNASVFKFMDMLPEKTMDDVPDPYYSGNFEEVYELVQTGCHRLLERLKAEV